MKDDLFSRRAAIFGAAALPLIRVVKGQSKARNVVISSANAFNGGVNCCAKAMEVIKGGGDTLDAHVRADRRGILKRDPSLASCIPKIRAADIGP